MEYLTHSLIDKSEALQIIQKLKAEKSSWQDGKKTAGSHAAQIKSNFQLDKSSNLSIELKDIVVNKIISNPLLKSFTLPSLIHGVMFTQSLAGHGYSSHIDNPYMPSGRSDLSFTLFLNAPEDYRGGELCIQTINKTEKIKLSDQHRGIKDMIRLPDVIVVVDGKTESIAIEEARKLEIPIVCIVDSNTNPLICDYPVPANDDSIRTIQLLITEISNVIVSANDAKSKKDNSTKETEED